MRSKTEDRRKHKRYKLENSVSISSYGIFQINDISEGGFSFRCPPYTAIPESWDIDVLTPFNQQLGFLADRVWFCVAENDVYGYLPMVVGAKFGKLDEEKKQALSKLIQAISENPDSA